MSVVALSRVVHEELQQQLKGVEGGILSGVASWDEYLRMTGKRAGLLQALAVVDEETQRFDNQE
jgi:hypothetical protein